MGTRKNAKFLTPSERENFVRACVLLKADIVNPGALASLRYSKWDEFAAVHWMIQEAFAPGSPTVNFGHGGMGAYSFLSWHRYFLFHMEQQLQTKVAGVTVPYWDWTDPTSIMTNTFMGPDGTTGGRVQQGYFAVNRPGTGPNTTTSPGWWPASLDGWTLSNIFPTNARGGLKRSTGAAAATPLPSPADIQQALAKANFPDFQGALEAGAGIASGHRLHNDMHKWIGGHMQILQASPFDPFFYLVHANVDRLWAMWQTDGHMNEYPNAGGFQHHRRNDLMYPWMGGAAGYGTNAAIAGSVPMPSWVTGPGAKTNANTLDFRNEFDYTYDTIPIMGIGLDRTGSMTGLTPDPMVVTDADVTKWEAAKRGVSAFLQDAETAQASGEIYLTAGVKTFRSLIANDFDSVFGAPDYGLIKTGSSFSKSIFDSNIASVTPGGSTPLADALQDVQNTLVETPFGGDPGDERRYLAMLTDGVRTSGSPMNSIPNGSFSRTAIFAMGFGTGADVSYTTLETMRNKGQILGSQQIFHGENAGTIDKFFSNSLAAAIGFTTIFDPVIELFAGEHTHLYFDATSAEDSFFITAQGMDFEDRNWKFMLHGPNGYVLYGDDMAHGHGESCHHCCPSPHVTAKRSDGRLTVVVQRGNTAKHCWVGKWELMIAYKAKNIDGMVMQMLGELMFPVAAGPIRGHRYSRLLAQPKKRTAVRNIFTKSQHGLDMRALSSNRNDNDACNITVNIYSRTNLKVTLDPKSLVIKSGEELNIMVNMQAMIGGVNQLSGFARMVAPGFDIQKLLPKDKVDIILKKIEHPKRENDGKKDGKCKSELDIALILGHLEKEKEGLEFIKDSEVKVVSHEGGPLHVHVKDTEVPGTYHFGIYVEGTYIPNAPNEKNNHEHGNMENAPANEGEPETFSRLLNISIGVIGA
ncbi:Common central domain of tyrosinase [Pricia antarctica]|uniref:Common central domain of tyrosinase n=1 Tax=Pricia antarctica TaxID=641691 RepID=A0A1G7EV08_9FLAO|nr:tyrosinase family protein [Pricia antarctica]SDE67533.1 Common central domain of tyrosinase [Pricia antarctica]